MKPIDQTDISKDSGTCMQAVLASLFERPLSETINVMDYQEEDWHIPFMEWIDKSTKYQYAGVVNAHSDKAQTLNALNSMYAVGGFYYGVVPSRNHDGVTHAVIIDRQGIVRHDPNPDKKWQGVNVVDSGDLIYWYEFTPKNGFVYDY